ncbi:serine hydrolase [Aquimarina sp. U1-2]|uniref:serine hydrolase domain-containing protein n=1 Tax=Aquimarina sp. U1-2 TaxID=2823141 RepID=UPI001AECD88D|nr:serine hydrolase [Aquimarina sp. U1-2]MBP2830622.1 serine hydrolase [Aquimarina sp. U1-2]
MIKYILVLVIPICCFLSCSNEESEIKEQLPLDPSIIYFPPIDADSWESLSIEDVNWNKNATEALYTFLKEKDTKAFIVLKNGRIIIEEYFNGVTATDRNLWYSAGKTLTSFMVGLAQQDNFLDIKNPSSTYLGTGWSLLTSDQERAIRVQNHLMMNTGLDYDVSNSNCTNKECLTYRNPPGDFWYYHNAPYTLLTSIITNATQQDFETYFNVTLKNKIGMEGNWLSLGFSNIYNSTARSMARFGLLILNKGTWDTTTILSDQKYFNDMVSTSQNLNASYGYLWWLNGKDSFRVPTSAEEFGGKLIPNAPNDLIAALGKNDQKLYVVPSQNLVIVRMGNDTGDSSLGPSGFDNDLWQKINAVID